MYGANRGWEHCLVQFLLLSPMYGANKKMIGGNLEALLLSPMYGANVMKALWE